MKAMEKKFVSKNGMPVYLYSNKNSHGFFISFFLKSGSMYESDEENGITHFLEHVAIRNINYIMNGELYPTLDRYGLEFNASTYSEMVQFYISGADTHFRIAADIIVKLLCPITLSPAEINLERGRIRAEIREVDERNSLAGFTSAIVFEGTSLARPITGSPGTVGRFTRKTLEQYRAQIFTPENLFVYITGNVSDGDAEYLASLIGNYELSKGQSHSNIAPVPNYFGKRDALIRIKNADFTKVRFTFDLDMTVLDTAVIDLLYETVLGGYNSSFFIELSEKSGMFYDITGATERYKNIGTFSFSYELRETKLLAALSKTVSLLKEIKEKPLHENRCMKAGFVDNAYLLYDDIRELNFTFAYDNHIIDCGYRNIDDRRERYSCVTPEHLAEAASLIFRPENLTLTLKGNKKKIDIDILREIVKGL
jgi:predicted Zn-dependent peptidase